MSEKSLNKRSEKSGSQMVDLFHSIGLFVIGATVVWSAVVAYLDMVLQGHATLKDILLLVIYLELGPMVDIYFKTHKLPVEFLIYIAITALTRMLTIDIKSMTNETILTVVGAILMLTLAILVLRHAAATKTKDDEPA